MVHPAPFFTLLTWLCIGPIPSGIAKMINLQQLNLSSNNFTGQCFVSNQTEVNLFRQVGTGLPVNHFLYDAVLTCISVGGIPKEIVNLSKLECLRLECNQLTGENFSLPSNDEVVNQSTISFVTLFLTWLCVGPIPPGIVELTKLENLNLRQNQLTG